MSRLRRVTLPRSAQGRQSMGAAQRYAENDFALMVISVPAMSVALSLAKDIVGSLRPFLLAEVDLPLG